jgi:hypothetical protein
MHCSLQKTAGSSLHAAGSKPQAFKAHVSSSRAACAHARPAGQKLAVQCQGVCGPRGVGPLVSIAGTKVLRRSWCMQEANMWAAGAVLGAPLPAMSLLLLCCCCGCVLLLWL